MALDPVIVLNVTMTIVLFVVGFYVYTLKKSRGILYIGLAFGILAISHILNLLGLAAGLTVPILIIRIVGYLLIIFGLLTFRK